MRNYWLPIVLLLAVGTTTYSIIVNIEADNFSPATEMTNLFDDITLSAVSFEHTLAGTPVYSVVSTKAISMGGQTEGKLGENVIGNGLNEEWNWGSFLKIKVNGLAKSAKVKFCCSYDNLFRTSVGMRAYDASGNQLGSGIATWVDRSDVDAKGLYLNPFSTYNITYFIVRANQGGAICIDDITVDFEPVPEPSTYTLTMNVEPNDIGIDTVTPLIGDHNATGLVNISAETYLDCPDVYLFDYWIGDVADVNSANTTVFMDSDKTITAVFVATRECGDECHPNDLFGDYNHDCIIDFTDFAAFADNWLVCTKPECD